MIFLNNADGDSCIHCGRSQKRNINISFMGRNENIIITLCQDCSETIGDMVQDHYSYGEEDEGE